MGISFLFVALTGLLAGFLSGLLGVGGGTIIIPGLVIFLSYTQRMAQGVSLAVIVPTALIGLYGYSLKGNVDLRTGLLLCAGSVPGTLIGSLIACSLPQAVLKALFGIFVIIIAIRILKDVFSK